MEKLILNIGILIGNLMKSKKKEPFYQQSNEAYQKRRKITSNFIIHGEKHTGWVGGDLIFICLFCLYVCFDISVV